MDAEEVIINLKLLSQVERGQKLITRDAYLNIEGPYIFIPEFVRRWNRQDNRHETIKKINSVINFAIAYIKEHPDETTFNVKMYLEHSKTGISNLKETYSICTQTCSRLDVLIDKINNFLEDK